MDSKVLVVAAVIVLMAILAVGQEGDDPFAQLGTYAELKGYTPYFFSGPLPKPVAGQSSRQYIIDTPLSENKLLGSNTTFDNLSNSYFIVKIPEQDAGLMRRTGNMIVNITVVVDHQDFFLYTPGEKGTYGRGGSYQRSAANENYQFFAYDLSKTENVDILEFLASGGPATFKVSATLGAGAPRQEQGETKINVQAKTPTKSQPLYEEPLSPSAAGRCSTILSCLTKLDETLVEQLFNVPVETVVERTAGAEDKLGPNEYPGVKYFSKSNTTLDEFEKEIAKLASENGDKAIVLFMCPGCLGGKSDDGTVETWRTSNELQAPQVRQQYQDFKDLEVEYQGRVGFATVGTIDVPDVSYSNKYSVRNSFPVLIALNKKNNGANIIKRLGTPEKFLSKNEMKDFINSILGQ